MIIAMLAAAVAVAVFGWGVYLGWNLAHTQGTPQ